MAGFGCPPRLTLAIGIGGTTAIFSLVHAVLLQPLPYPEPDRLVRIWETNSAEGGRPSAVSPGTFIDWRERSRAFADIALFSAADDEPADMAGTVIGTPVGTRQVRDATVSADFFSVMGVAPALGPGITGALVADTARTVVIGHDLWRTAFGSDPDVIGKPVTIEARSVQTIAGVMPEGFTFPGDTQLWSADDFTRVGLTRRG